MSRLFESPSTGTAHAVELIQHRNGLVVTECGEHGHRDALVDADSVDEDDRCGRCFPDTGDDD